MRRSAAAWIVLGGALGVFGCASATAPALAPPPDSTPAGVAIVVPDSPEASGAAPGKQAPARSSPEHFAGPTPDNAPAPQPATPKLRVEPAIGVTVMRLVPEDGAQPASASEPARPAPALYEAGTETSVVSLSGSSGAPKNAERSADAAGGAAADAALQASGKRGGNPHAAATRGDAVSAATSGGTQISFTVGDAPAGGAPASADTSAAAKADASADSRDSAHAPAAGDAGAGGRAGADAGAPPACDVTVLHDKPKAAAREVATFKLDGEPAERDQIMSLLKRRACEAGANALLIKKPTSAAATPGAYHVEAVALLLESAKPADRKPVPKTIEVPLPSKPAPKTIEVDPDAPR